MLTTIAAGRVYNFSHSLGRLAATGAGFLYPTALTLGQDDVVYVVNRGNENAFGARIGKVTIGAPGDEEFVCEFGQYGEQDGQFLWPGSVALDKKGNVYVADEWLHRISIFDEDGDFLYRWGTPGADDGEFNRPSGIAFDREDNLYVVDSVNNRIQRFTKEGRFLSNFGEGGSGEGQFNLPWGITIDNQGDLYVADWENNRVQKFSTDGTFLTTFGTFGTGIGELDHPTDVAVDSDGDVYVADWANQRVQIFASNGDAITSLIGDAQELTKWGRPQVEANPDMIKARRRVKSLEPEWRFRYPTALAFDEAKSSLIVTDCQNCRLQIYIKDKEYVDPQFNL